MKALKWIALWRTL